MKKLWLLIWVFCFVQTKAQKQGNIWYFGDHAGVDFNSSTPTPLTNGQIYYTGMEWWTEGCSSISDSSGSLLFYTNGVQIWDKTQQVMPNGNNLMGHISSTQSSLILPKPGSNRYFYVFATDALENNFTNGLTYSVVDICLNNGLGDVIIGGYEGSTSLKNIKLVDVTTEKLVAVKHSNGNDYWVIVHQFNSDAFYALRLTSTGIKDTVISHTGTQDPIGWGQMKASPNGKKIGYTTPSAANGFILLLDFDPTTGIVSNEQTLATGSRCYGLSFSPNSSYLYCSDDGIGNVYQYNLNAGNLASIIASQKFIIQNGPDSWRQMQLAPNGKIYLSRASKTYLCEIEFPNNLYPSCNYIDSAVYLGGKLTSFGLPNYCDSYNYSNTTYDCSAGIAEINNTNNLLIYPNPAQNNFTIETSTTEKQTLQIFDVTGKQVLTQIINGTTAIDAAQLENGVYFVRLKNDSGISTKKLVVQR